MKAEIYTKELWIDQTSPLVLKETYTKMLKEAGFTILNSIEHFFHPYGYTCVFLLAESHFAIHTFPEEGKTFIQLSSCNKEMFQNWLEIYNKD